MLILIGFAVLAGAGTALSPCVLPVLPALLASGGVGGKRRPLGVVIGLTVTFTVTIVGVADVVDGVGLGSDPLRDVAVAVLIASGLALIVPGLADRLEARLSRIAAFGASGASNRGDGFRSGLVVGAALGFVYTPCAGTHPGRGHLGERGQWPHGGGGHRLFARQRGRAVRPDARRAQAVRPDPRRRARSRPAAHARRDHAGDGLGDRRGRGRALRPVRGRTHPQRQPDGRPGEIQSGRESPARADGSWREVRDRRENTDGAPQRQRRGPARRRARPEESRAGP